MTSGGRGSFRTGEGLPFPRFISSSGTSQPDTPRVRPRSGDRPSGIPVQEQDIRRPLMRGCRQASSPAGPRGPVRPSASRPPWTVDSGTASDGRFPLSRGNRPPRRTPTAMCIAFSLWNTYLFRKASGRSRMGCCLDAALPYHDHPAAGPGPSCPSPGQHGVRARPSPPRIREPFPEALPFPAPKEAP